MTSVFTVLLLAAVSLCTVLNEVRGDELRAVPASPSSAKGARTLDRLSGGEYVRGLDGRRRLDKISGGELLRSADDAALLRSLVLPYALRAPVSDPRRGLDKIGGGEYIRAAGALPPGSAAKRRAPHENAPSNASNSSLLSFDERCERFARNFDEIDRSGFEGFYKRSGAREK
ncbi:uncharacterized protein [Dermacentor andersoni]|uniref:uncharacterized protein n=1 Tax=Dermacentor andersoni TaxID=34620 RepID=UPI003B3A2887